MTTSVNKTWGGGNSTWATAAQWRNDDGTTSAAIPATTATATINGGTCTVAAQTIANLNIGGSCTIAGTGLTVTGNLYVASGTTLTFSGTAVLAVQGNLYVDGAIQQTSTTGSLTLSGAGNVEGRFGGSSNYVRVIIAKTSAGNTVTFSTDLHCEYVNTTTAGFTFTSGTINQNGFTIYTRTLTNSSATARNWAMSGNLYITLGTTGTSISASQTTCTYTNRDGAIRTSGVVATQTMTFGSGIPSTCPRLYLDTDTTYVISGSLWDFYPNGTHTTATTLVVFNELSDAAATNKTYTGMTLNRVASSAGSTLTTNCSTRFGAIQFFGAWTSGTTYTGSATHNIDFCRANAINNQAIANCAWNFNSIEIGTTGFTINQLSTGTKSTVTVAYARPISGVTNTTNVWGASGTGTAGWDIFIENWDVPGTITHGGGNLYIGYTTGNSVYTTNFSHNTTTRAQNFGTYWGDATWIVSKSNQTGAPTNGAVNLNATNFTCNSTNGGWKLAGTGSNVLGAMNNTTQQILVYVTGSNVTIGSGTIAYLGIENGGTITATSTLTINKGYIYRTGESPGALTGLNLTLTTSDNYTYNFDRKIGTLTLATSAQTWALDNAVCTNLTLSGSTGCTYNFNGGAVSGTTTCNGGVTYNWNGGTLGTNTVWTNGFFSINGGDSFNAGVLTFNSGSLVLNTNLNTISFTSASGSTRFINWVQQGRITSSGAGVITISNQTNLTWGTVDNDPYWVGGFQHGGSGAATGLAWTATVPSFRFNTWHTGSGTYTAWYTQTFRALSYSTCTGASSVFIAGDFYAENGVISLNGIALTQIFNSGTIIMDGDPISIGSYTHAINDASQQNLTRLIAYTITLTGQRVTYNFGDLANDYYNYVKITTNGTLTLNGKDSSYNLYRVKSYNTAVVAAVSTSDTMYVYVYDYQHNLYGATVSDTYTGISGGTFTITNGQVTVKSGYTLQTYAFQNGDNARPNRALKFEDGAYIQTNGSGFISSIYSSVCTYVCMYDNSGFLHNATGQVTLNGTPLGQDNCANLTIYKAASIGSSLICRNFNIVDGGGFSAGTVSCIKNWTGYTTNNISGLSILHTLYSGDVTYNGNPVNLYTHSVSDSTLNAYNLPAYSITLNGQRTRYNLGSLTNQTDNFVRIHTTGTLTLSGKDSTYNLYSVRSYNTTIVASVTTSDTMYVNCYNYSHNFYNSSNPTAYDQTSPTGGTFTITNGQLTVKSGYTLVTHSFLNADNARPNRACNFESNSYIKTINTGTISILYSPTLISVSCPYANCGFYHDSTGAINITGTPTLSDPSSAYNLKFVRGFAMTNISYIRDFNNQLSIDGLGGGYIASYGGSGTIGALGDVDITGNIFDSSLGARTTWQSLSFTYAGTSGATQTLTTFRDYPDVGGDSISRINILTLLSTFTGTVQLVANGFRCTTAVLDGGTLALNGRQLYVQTSVTSTNGTANKSITTTATNYTVPGIYINATTGTPWSYAYSNLLVSDWRVWVYVRGGTVSHGATARQSPYQPSFDLTERVNAYTLAPTTAFQVGSLKINNYTVPTNSVWSVGGPEFTVYTGGLSAPANFTVNIVDGEISKTTTEMYCDNTTFIWPQVTISTNTKLISDWKFKNIYIDAGTTTSPGITASVTQSLSTSGGSGATLNITGSTWIFTGATAINYGFLGVGIFVTSDNLTGIARFDGLNGTNLGDQYAGFGTNFGDKIVNNISYNSTTDVGTLFLEAGYSTNTALPLAGQIDVGYNNASFSFRSDHPGGNGFPIKGSTFNLGKNATKRLRSYSGNWSNHGLYNTEASSVVDLDYLDLTDCFAKGGGGWYAGGNSVDRGGNTGTTGWYFYSPATFSLSRSASTVNEGSSVTITLTTNAPNNSVIPYTITGITSADISGASLTGNFTVSSGTASVVLNIAADYTTENTETLTFSLNNGAASIAVIVNDTSLDPTYSLSRSAVTVTEGDSFTITLSTTNLPNGFTVPYTITGVDRSDINGASLTGNFTISSNTASLVIVTTWDYVTEGQEILTLTLNPTYGTGSAISVAINNKLHPTYALSASPTILYEGGNFTVTLNTTDVPNGTTVPYTITGITSADINGVSLTGNFTISSNSASVTFTTSADYLTEGTETLTLTLDTIGTFVEINILDYYKTRTYALSTSATTVTEGDSFTITLTTTNVFDGTTVPYTISGTGITSADINNASLTGNFTVTGGSGTQTFVTTADLIAEGNETFTLTLGSPASGSINVTIRDPIVGSQGNFLSFFE